MTREMETKDIGDLEWEAALNAAKKWLPGKPPEIWRWMEWNQNSSHDEFGILEWMETQAEYHQALASAKPNETGKMPAGYEEHLNAETWDFFQAIFNGKSCPRPGSAEYKRWLIDPPPEAHRMYPDVFPENRIARIKRISFGIFCIIVLIYLLGFVVFPRWWAILKS